ncbi:hypothetical protein [Mesorhizobium sp. B4-1-4]|uniref:hypothetical protein n=1 Tax=Mesorhizobium sp. B4-1-4 TaxID=2589888 RepID=UPI00112DB196|nr:hypothetical protein [Mesorhizobium sp. B4-1-4]UCI31689.1 hypothetical protein FJW03_28680 [Mesorhizobium sp. B4-1-4]
MGNAKRLAETSPRFSAEDIRNKACAGKISKAEIRKAERSSPGGDGAEGYDQIPLVWMAGPIFTEAFTAVSGVVSPFNALMLAGAFISPRM